jgi:hypothetical protein
MSETTDQPGQRFTRCPAVTFPAPGLKEQCTILVREDHGHGGLHRWPNEDLNQLPTNPEPSKGPKTMAEAVMALGLFTALLAFVAFLIAWFTR